jgi:SAM-dependent methyltransferase
MKDTKAACPTADVNPVAGDRAGQDPPPRRSSDTFVTHPVRGRFNAGFFSVLDSYINWLTRDKKRRYFSELPPDVVEVGAGTGANFRYMPPRCRVIAIEPNAYMQGCLQRRAARYGIDVEIRTVAGDAIDLDDQSADAVISSLLLCTVADPQRVVGEIRRILRPGGQYAFLEHVSAPENTLLRSIQHGIRRPWAWVFEGCSCERDLAAVIDGAGFASVEIDHYRLRSPFLPANTQIAGRAIA